MRKKGDTAVGEGELGWGGLGWVVGGCGGGNSQFSLSQLSVSQSVSQSGCHCDNKAVGHSFTASQSHSVGVRVSEGNGRLVRQSVTRGE